MSGASPRAGNWQDDAGTNGVVVWRQAVKTSCFSCYRGPGRIGISVGRPRGEKWTEYEVYPALAPERAWLGLPYEEYRPLYLERLQALDAQQVWDELHRLVPGQEPVLLCFEEPPLTAENWCHRRMVAEWFRDGLGVEVAEMTLQELSNQAVVQEETHTARPASRPRQRLSEQNSYVSPSSRLLDEPVTLEEFQELCERHYLALETWWQTQRKVKETAAVTNEIELALRQVRAGYKRMSELERALALQRRMFPESLIEDL